MRSIKNWRTLAIFGVKDLDQMKTHLEESGGIKKGLEESKKVWNGSHPNNQIMVENQELDHIKTVAKWKKDKTTIECKHREHITPTSSSYLGQ